MIPEREHILVRELLEKEEANKQLRNELLLLKGERDGLGSLLLDVQQDCIKLRKAISPFVSFKLFVDALRETQQEKPLTEHDCIVSAMGSGASDYIWYGELMRAEQALRENK